MGFIKKLFSSQNKTISVLEANSMLKRTNELANIANKTTDRNEFYNSINEIKDILRELSKYEGKLPFIGSPSADLKNLERMEKSQIELLEKRIEEKEKSAYVNYNAYSDEFKIEEYYRAKNEELDDYDEYIVEAGRLAIEKDKASIGMIQRAFKIGFNRAMRIMDELQEMGVVSEENGTKPRKILVTRQEYENIVENYHPKINPVQKEERNTHYRTSLYNNQYDYMEGHDFEYFCADVLRKNGFTNVEVTQESGDHGIDIMAEKNYITYAIQCKCYSSNIGNAAVQQAHTGKSIYHKDIAVVLTNRYFTQQAKEEAVALGVKLWDRDKLNEMIKNND